MSVQPGLRGSNDLRVGRKMATFQLFFQPGRAKDLSAPPVNHQKSVTRISLGTQWCSECWRWDTSTQYSHWGWDISPEPEPPPPSRAIEMNGNSKELTIWSSTPSRKNSSLVHTVRTDLMPPSLLFIAHRVARSVCSLSICCLPVSFLCLITIRLSVCCQLAVSQFSVFLNFLSVYCQLAVLLSVYCLSTCFLSFILLCLSTYCLSLYYVPLMYVSQFAVSQIPAYQLTVSVKLLSLNLLCLSF